MSSMTATVVGHAHGRQPHATERLAPSASG
jgi:hypothetical protein